MDLVHVLVAFLQGQIISGQSCFYRLRTKAYWYEAEETLLCFSMPRVLCSVEKSLSGYCSCLLNWLEHLKCESKFLVEKKLNLRLLKKQTAILLNSEGLWMPRKGFCWSFWQKNWREGGRDEEADANSSGIEKRRGGKRRGCAWKFNIYAKLTKATSKPSKICISLINEY